MQKTMLNVIRFAHVAQLAEHVLGKDEVTSSILVMGSIKTLKGSREQRGSKRK